MDRLTLPNVVTLSRLAAVAAILVAAAGGHRSVVVGTLAYALVSDVVDGALARRLNQRSAFGAALDSWADCFLYLSTPVALGLLFPYLWRDEAATIGAIWLGYAIPITAGALKYRRLTSYHTIASRVAGVALAGGTFWFVLTGGTWPVRAAAVVLVIAAIEEVLLTRLLPEWRADIRSLRTARRLRAHGPSAEPSATN